MPAGRPSKYDSDEALQILSGLGHEGEGMAEAAVALGICRDTFYRWMDQHQEFSDAVKDMRTRSQAWWERKGRLGTFGETEGFSGVGFVFNMKNRFPEDWRDKVNMEHEGGISVTLEGDADKL